MQIRLINNEEFKNFANNFIDKSPYQTVEYAESMKTEGFGFMLIGLFDNEIIKAATMLLINSKGKYNYAYAPRGFLINYCDFNLVKEFTEELKKFLLTYSIIAIKLCPMIIKNTYDCNFNTMYHNKNYVNIMDNLKKLGYYHYGFNYKFEALKPRYEAIIDLDKPYYEAFKIVSKKFKTKIRNAERNGIKIYKSTQESIELLYKQTQTKYPRSLEYLKSIVNTFKNNAELYYAKLDTTAYLQEINNKYLKQEQKLNVINKKIIKKSNNKLIKTKINDTKTLEKIHRELEYATNLAKYNNNIVLASLLLIKQDDKIYVLIDSFDKKYKQFNAKHLLIWKLIEKYCKEGLNQLNLGGIPYTLDKNDKYYNLLNYKLSLGANVFEYVGDFELIINKKDYNNYKNFISIKKLFKNE